MKNTLRAVTLAMVATACAKTVSRAPESVLPTETPASIATVPECDMADWCWVRGRNLRVENASSGISIASGDEGFFAMRTAGAWVEQRVPTNKYIASAHALNANEAWAVALDGPVWHRMGTTWSVVSLSQKVFEVFGTADATYGIASVGAGEERSLVQWRKDVWERVSPASPCAIAGFAVLENGELWSAGTACVGLDAKELQVQRLRDGVWEPVGASFSGSYGGVGIKVVNGTMQTAARQGMRDGLFQWDGSTWQYVAPRPAPSLPAGLREVWDGTVAHIVPDGPGCREVIRAKDGELLCALSGHLFGFRDGTWSEHLDDPFRATRAAAEWGTIPPALWAGSDSERAWGTSKANVYRFGKHNGNKLEHYDGAKWTVVVDAESTDVDGTSASDVWVGTKTGLQHFDGRSFSPVAIASLAVASYGVLDVLALASGVVVVLQLPGSQNLVYALQNGSWRLIHGEQAGVQDFNAWDVHSVEGAAFDDLYAVETRSKADARFVRFDGARWSSQSFGDVYRDRPDSVHVQHGRVWMTNFRGITEMVNGRLTPEIDGRLHQGSLWIGASTLWLWSPAQATRKRMAP
jgi:hypothetical protein